jgi:Fe-S cluster assembly protein SufD
LAICPRTVIVAETGADVTYIDDYASEGLAHPDTGQGFSSSVVEIVARPGARVRYVSLQEWDSSVWSFSTHRAMVDADATVNSLVVAFGGRLSKARVQTHLRGRGASAEMLGVLFGTDRQHFDHHTAQQHIAPNTTSELLYKAVLKDQARSVFSGIIKAHKNAQKTDAVQTNRNLLLSPKSRADSIPNLEIEANDLRCTHAAAVAPVDEEQLFYLQARGLQRPDAVRLIVEGFFEPLLERIPLPGIRERLRASVEARIG